MPVQYTHLFITITKNPCLANAGIFLLCVPVRVYAFGSALTTGFVFFVALAGLLLPNDPWKRFPFAVFLSPLPMIGGVLN